MRDILYIELCERILIIILIITSLYYYYHVVEYSNYYFSYYILLLSLLLLFHFIKSCARYRILLDLKVVLTSLISSPNHVLRRLLTIA